jgi:hypothetical protein
MFFDLRERFARVERAIGLATELNRELSPHPQTPPTRWSFDNLEAEGNRLNSFARQAFDPGFFFAEFPIPTPGPLTNPRSPPIDRPHRIIPPPSKPNPFPKERRQKEQMDLPVEDLIAMSPRRRAAHASPESPPPTQRSRPSRPALDDDLDRFVDEIATMRNW